MNILLIGGPGGLADNIILKLNKEGHRVYLLTGNRYTDAHFQKVFERYDFPYDTISLNDIFDSTLPDVTLYLGAHDTNYTWADEKTDSSKYIGGLLNLLMAYSIKSSGRFIYLSSDEVYAGSHEGFLTEDTAPTPSGNKSTTLAQAEELCKSFRMSRQLDVTTLRLDNLYGIPESKPDATSIPCLMCIEALASGRITYSDDTEFSLLYETDAIEYIYRVLAAKECNSELYNISSCTTYTKADIARSVQSCFDENLVIEEKDSPTYYNRRVILSNSRYNEEFGCSRFCDFDQIISKIAAIIKRSPEIYVEGNKKKESIFRRAKRKLGWFINAIIPFLENLIIGFILYKMSNSEIAADYFSKVDFYLLYVFIFGAVYGQQQAAFSGLLASIVFCINRLGTLEGGELLLDPSTYVWMAQLFIVGLSVGYMRDTIRKMVNEADDEKDFISKQLHDIQSINSSNVRVKDALETQILNQSDSVGKIYGITSALDQYSQDEVLFYATEMIGNLMHSKDVAIYSVSNGDYARLFAASSPRARIMGNSLKYTGTGELYESLVNKKVYINRKMDAKLPMMSSAIYEGDKMQVIIMVWGLPWESMTLGQANQLTVIGALIQNAVLRANRYLDVLENERYAENSRMMEPEAFSSLVNAYLTAQRRGLTECVMLEISPLAPGAAAQGALDINGAGAMEGAGTAAYGQQNASGTAASDLTLNNVEAANLIGAKLRNSDYVGEMPNGKLYVLLSNTSPEGADIIMNRFRDMGFDSRIVKEAGADNMDIFGSAA